MSSAKTALGVLEIVGQSGNIGVSELARLMEEPKSTIQRSLETLHEAGWITPSDGPGHRRWNVTTKALTLTRTLEPVALLREHARPEMEYLRNETRETIHLMLREGARVVLIERFESPQTVRTVSYIGAKAPLHIASNGKAILATLTQPEQDAYLGRPLEAVTARSITDPARLRAELELTASRGFALSDGELDLEVRAVAAAIFSRDRRAIGAMSISCPAHRLPPERADQLGPLVAAAAQRVSERLAHG